MKIHKDYKYRLKTNRHIMWQFVQFAGACRFVWNKVLAINEARYLAGVPRLTYHEAAWLLTLWKHSEAYSFLASVHSQVLQQCLTDLERAYSNLYAGRAKPPTYRKKFLADTFRYPQGFQLDGPQVYLPKIGWVRFWKSRDIEGIIKNATVSRSGKHWYVALQVEMDIPDPIHPSTACVGIDLGIATFAALSNATLIPPLNALRTLQAPLARAQQTLARKVKFSQNWQQQKARITRIHTKIANCRRDFLHKHSTEISKNHAVIVVEDLQVAHMSRSAKGHGGGAGTRCCGQGGLEQSYPRPGLGPVSHHVGVQTSLAWRHGDSRLPTLHLAAVCRVWLC